jgi:hypothetical protein
VCRGILKSSPESKNRVYLQPHHAQLRKKRIKSKNQANSFRASDAFLAEEQAPE